MVTRAYHQRPAESVQALAVQAVLLQVGEDAALRDAAAAAAAAAAPLPLREVPAAATSTLWEPEQLRPVMQHAGSGVKQAPQLLATACQKLAYLHRVAEPFSRTSADDGAAA